MEFVLHIIMFYFVIINCIYYLYTDLINKYLKKNQKSIIMSYNLILLNQLIFVLFNIDVFTKINIFFFAATFLFFKVLLTIIPNKNIYFVIIINLYFLFKNALVYSLVDLIVLIEIFNLSLNLFILNNNISKLHYRKSFYIILITLNIFSISLFSILYCITIVLFKTTNIGLLTFILKTGLFNHINIYIFIIILIKLGFIVGPKFTKQLYLSLPYHIMCVYVYYYYTLFPYILLPLFNIVFIDQYIQLLIILTILVSNIYYFTTNYSVQHLFFLSSQINLIYIQLLFV